MSTIREPKTRSFPWLCPACAREAVESAEVPYTATIRHDGCAYRIDLPALRVPRCGECGELVFGNDADEQIAEALRDRLSLSQPAEIRSQREGLGMNQRQLAELLGVAPETISRWETGLLIQSRAMDNLLRLCFAIPQVRDLLIGRAKHLALVNAGSCENHPAPCGIESSIAREDALTGRP